MTTLNSVLTQHPSCVQITDVSLEGEGLVLWVTLTRRNFNDGKRLFLSASKVNPDSILVEFMGFDHQPRVGEIDAAHVDEFLRSLDFESIVVALEVVKGIWVLNPERTEALVSDFGLPMEFA